MRDVLVRGAPLHREVVGISRRIARDSIIDGLVGQILGPGVGAQDAESVAEPLVQGNLQPVVRRVEAEEVTPQFAVGLQGTAALDVGAILSEGQIRVVDGGVLIVESHQVRSLGSHVGHAQPSVREDLAFHG